MRDAVVARLVCHPSTPADDVRAIEVEVRRPAPRSLALAFALVADLTRIRVPPAGEPRIAHQLWEHTCFEAFVAAADADAYTELNFAPSREWAAYGFSSYRQPVAAADAILAPHLDVQHAPPRLRLEARVELDRLPIAAADRALQLGISAVIEETGGRLSYWALRHPERKPDFHDRRGWTIRIAPQP